MWYRYNKLNPWLLVLAAVLLVGIIVLAVELHIRAGRTSPRANSFPTALTFSSATPSSTPREASSDVVVTTSSWTSYSAFNTVIVRTTETTYYPQPTIDSSSSKVQETILSITTASPSTTFQTTVANTVFETSGWPASTPVETVPGSLEPHGPTVYNLVEADTLNQTLPLSKRRPRPSGMDATEAKALARPDGWRSKKSDV